MINIGANGDMMYFRRIENSRIDRRGHMMHFNQ